MLVFGEYICNPIWRDEEHKAFQEFVQRSGASYRYPLFSPFSRQTAAIIELVSLTPYNLRCLEIVSIRMSYSFHGER